jgi:hypothetical protein
MQTDRQKKEWQADKRTGRQATRPTSDKQADKQENRNRKIDSSMDRWRGGQMYRQTDRQKDGQTDRRTDGQTKRYVFILTLRNFKEMF